MRNGRWVWTRIGMVLLIGLALSAPAMAATTADVIVVVDESGSMGGEHAWIGPMIASLDAALSTAGVTGNRFGLVGFGGSSTHGIGGHSHLVGGGQFGTAAQFATAAGGLVLSGGTEDGWDGIDEALGYSFRPSAAVNIILVTDEDRDNYNTALTYAGVLSNLTGKKALLNAVVNAGFKNGAGEVVLGVDSDGKAYKADGAGGFTTSSGGYVYTDSGTTKENYVDLAWATGAAAWNINLLRAGGLTATSFTKAFVDIKVTEIVVQEPAVPLPAAAPAGLMLLAALAGSRTLRRRL